MAALVTETPQPAEKPKLRWYQYSLRSLMIFVAVVCFVMGWLGWYLRPRLAFTRAAAPIWQLDGSVYGNPNLGVKGIRGVYFWENLSNADPMTLIEHLEALPNLERLDLSDTQDARLEHLKRLTELKTLVLHGTQVTDAGLVHLKGLTKLEELILWHTGVTDAGLIHLKGLTNLEYLQLGCTQVSDDGVKQLRQALPDCYIEYWPAARGKSPMLDWYISWD